MCLQALGRVSEFKLHDYARLLSDLAHGGHLAQLCSAAQLCMTPSSQDARPMGTQPLVLCKYYIITWTWVFLGFAACPLNLATNPCCCPHARCHVGRNGLPKLLDEVTQGQGKQQVFGYRRILPSTTDEEEVLKGMLRRLVLYKENYLPSDSWPRWAVAGCQLSAIPASSPLLVLS
jgi:hypothetical protein